MRNLAVSVYDLIPSKSEQLEIFSSPTHAVAEAMDKINDRWGEICRVRLQGVLSKALSACA
jgi:hypothetical protein